MITLKKVFRSQLKRINAFKIPPDPLRKESTPRGRDFLRRNKKSLTDLPEKSLTGTLYGIIKKCRW
jgi:hypothetical protein